MEQLFNLLDWLFVSANTAGVIGMGAFILILLSIGASFGIAVCTFIEYLTNPLRD
jgi:hypothetical protein